MKSLYNKTIKQKMIIVLTLVIFLFNFIMPTYSHADIFSGVTLFAPIKEFICAVGDGVMNVLQDTFIKGAPRAVETAQGNGSKFLAGLGNTIHEHGIATTVVTTVGGAYAGAKIGAAIGSFGRTCWYCDWGVNRFFRWLYC